MKTLEQGMGKGVVLASADAGLRQRLRESLTGLRWRVYEASGGAEAMSLLEERPTEALLMDDWLPDLEATELAGQAAAMYPHLEVLRVNGGALSPARSSRRHELLHALREAREPREVCEVCEVGDVRTDTVAWQAAPLTVPEAGSAVWVDPMVQESRAEMFGRPETLVAEFVPVPVVPVKPVVKGVRDVAIPGLVGESEPMLELARMIRLVAPHDSTVLIEGETGTGKEVVAEALHRLSARSARPLTVLNCAAIPEALIESELFGHTRGAFTGAVQSRTGRIEAAHRGTLFLDEIGELPLAVQSKLLRFLECGELQRVGDNDVVRVDVRVIAATHQRLEQRVEEGTFRLDLYHRLAVFPLEVPSLRERKSDLAALVEHLLGRLGEGALRKRMSDEAFEVLRQHDWPGNVRELAHVLERAVILAGGASVIAAEHIRCRCGVRQ